MLVEGIHHNQTLETLIRTDLTRHRYPIPQRAIMDTMACIFQIEPTLITKNERILDTINKALNGCRDICDFTEKEKMICNTPEGVLCTFDDEHHSRKQGSDESK